LAQALEQQGVPETVRLAWLRIDQGLRTSVLSTGVQARERTRS